MAALFSAVLSGSSLSWCQPRFCDQSVATLSDRKLRCQELFSSSSHSGCPAQRQQNANVNGGILPDSLVFQAAKLNPATQAVRPVAVGAADPNFVLSRWESKGNEIWKTSDASRMAPTSQYMTYGSETMRSMARSPGSA